jgi:DNA-binding NarL/FixJ family response regulator
VSPSRPSPTAIDPKEARIVLIEDDVLLGDLLCMGFKHRFAPADLKLFNNGKEGLAYCRAEKPDLVMVDLGLPDMDGREVIRTLHHISPDTRVIVLTGQVNPTLPGQLLALGVSGYVDKASSFENAEGAVKRVLAGGIFFSAGVRPAPTTANPWPAGGNPDGDTPPEALSEREREIARLVAGGLISKEIADQLKLSPRTVEKARAQLLDKLRVRDLPSLVRWCVKHGLV